MGSSCPTDGCRATLHYEEFGAGSWRVQHGDNPEASRVFDEFECVWGRNVKETARRFPLFALWLDQLHAYERAA